MSAMRMVRDLNVPCPLTIFVGLYQTSVKSLQIVVSSSQLLSARRGSILTPRVRNVTLCVTFINQLLHDGLIVESAVLDQYKSFSPARCKDAVVFLMDGGISW